MTDLSQKQIEHMVRRFLAWHLPLDFKPDGGVSFSPIANAGTPYEFTRDPTGTNLLTGAQAEAMVRHMLQDMPG